MAKGITQTELERVATIARRHTPQSLPSDYRQRHANLMAWIRAVMQSADVSKVRAETAIHTIIMEKTGGTHTRSW